MKPSVPSRSLGHREGNAGLRPADSTSLLRLPAPAGQHRSGPEFGFAALQISPVPDGRPPKMRLDREDLAPPREVRNHQAIHSRLCHDGASPRMRERIEGLKAVSLAEVLSAMSESAGLL